ncbi:hypothetical protein FSP39_011935 [Pinctada imbricata]|uniref:Uncharacterized protein n=1 Tax=Pinctada imbricata TaxID=66713 RepID=A0AA88YIM7_PINIB|nr:hypothetical protein FSP39_011935 [Pinctada imbricata]
MAKNRAAIYIHGNMFEEFVLKAAKGERSNVFVIKDESVKTVWSRIKERKKQFKEIHNENMTQDYEDAMTLAGIRAWETLSSLARSRNCSNHECEVKFEEVVQNKTASKLKEYLRADFVARTKTTVFLVDLKFSSMETSAFEEQYLVNGILQVLIYSLVMDIEPGDLSLGVLVYYGREGMVVLYTTDIRNDQESMEILRQCMNITCLKRNSSTTQKA